MTFSYIYLNFMLCLTVFNAWPEFPSRCTTHVCYRRVPNSGSFIPSEPSFVILMSLMMTMRTYYN